MKIHIIMHEAFEGPGAIANWMQDRQYEASYTKLYKGEQLPTSVDDFDFLIVLGGPQSPYTTQKECSYFNADAELEFIKKAVDSDKLVLGICLGAQLISNALGGKTIASPHKEIGLFPISLTEEGKNDELFADFPKTVLTGHWHGDMPGLTDDSVIIAISEGCPRQIVRFTPKAYGFQCHFEFTPNAIDAMICNCSDELDKDKNKTHVQSAEQLKANDYSSANLLLFSFLDRFIEKHSE